MQSNSTGFDTQTTAAYLRVASMAIALYEYANSYCKWANGLMDCGSGTIY